MSPPLQENTVRDGYCIYVDSVAEGQVPLWWDENGKPVVYDTQAAAQREIADDLINRLREFIQGERDFDDAITIEEYIVPVSVFGDGSIADEDGNYFVVRASAPHIGR